VTTQAAAAAGPSTNVVPLPTAATGAATKIVALPVPVDLAIYKGDDFDMTVSVTETDGTPADLSGFVPLAQIRSSPQSDPALASFIASIDTVDPSIIHLALSHVATAELPPRTVWDCQVTAPSGRISTLVAGALVTVPEVSR
jgi:hypothetical protein